MNNESQIRVSLIVAVYKDIEALDIIIQALKNQTYKNFEVLIVEDNNAEEMKNYISSIKDLDVKHVFQDDNGIRKTRSLNNGILASEGDYLVFIDGDCIPYSTFIESHVRLSETGYVVSGRRCNLGPRYTSFLREHKLSPIKLEKSFIVRSLFIAFDATEGHTEAGIYFNPNSFFYKVFLKNMKTRTSILGCNYSCFKKDMIKINGYDERYKKSSLGDDTDLEWRFKATGLKLKSAKNIANVFHLYHKRTARELVGHKEDVEKMRENMNNNNYVCKEGLNTH